MTAWAWDATQATIDQKSAAKIKDFLAYCGSLGYFTAEIGRIIREPGTPVYTKSLGHGLDDPLAIPQGTQPGVSTDGHLLIVDNIEDRWHDIELYKWPGGSTITKVTNGISMTKGAVQEPSTKGSATAAKFPLARGAVTPDQVAAGRIPHALVFTAANLGPAPNPYPANSQVGYTTGNLGAWAGKSVSGHLPLGTWLRMDPAATLPPSASLIERVIFKALQEFGMFCRDRGSTVAIHGIDDGGGGKSRQAWNDAGVPLGTSMSVKLPNIPWNRLQLLKPPAAS